MISPNEDHYKIPIIAVNGTSWSVYSIFNQNDWTGNSKMIIMSCASQYGLLGYQVSKIPSLLQYSKKMCESEFLDLKSQWEKASWNVDKFDYLVEIPEYYLNITAYLETLKTFLDLIVQLISTEGIVNPIIHGFHTKGKIIGGDLLNILENNAKKDKSDTACKLNKFMNEQKNVWIDKAIAFRSLLVHPNKGMPEVMFKLAIGRENGKLELRQVLQPSLSDLQFDQYAQITLLQVEYFSKKFIEILQTV